MITFDQWVLPDGETHLPEWMRKANHRVNGRLTYQKHKYDAALRHCRVRRLAVDVGAHVGLWSYWMARDFARLVAIEPKAAHAECWDRNLAGCTTAILHRVALGATHGVVALETGPASSGDTRVATTREGTIPRVPLDALELVDVDFLKIDCEGYEAFVIEGARETLMRCRPVVVVEQKPGFAARYGRGEIEAVEILESLGARRAAVLSGDYVLVFPPNGSRVDGPR